MGGSRVGVDRSGAIRSARSARHCCHATPTLMRTIKVIYLVYPPLLIVVYVKTHTHGHIPQN